MTASRRDRVLAAAFLVVMAVAAVFLLRTGRLPHSAGTAAGSSPIREAVLEAAEITVRNVIDVPVDYAITPYGSTEPGSRKTLLPGAVDRYRAKGLLVIGFDRKGRALTRSLTPGRPYTFRYDEHDLLEIWLGSHGREDAEDLAPYVATPRPVLDRMLEMAGVGAEDFVYDIGCGDGRIVIAAAVRFGARGVGIDIDPERIRESRENAEKAMVGHLVSFICGDATKADISEATVVTLYLLPESNALLRPKLDRELKPGTRVVSHNYVIPGWESREAESARVWDGLDKEHAVYLYKR
ncbi:MAG TPA: methyltransferase domain-containing protein [Acidobacteriota bacterium]|nr:methyltransferase domain-containing protein [Acidobacteriota bacterium]